MFIIKGFLDRVLFAVGVLLFMQVPHFVDQYTHRLGGYYQAQANHLEQYQQIANKQHQGDLDALIQAFTGSEQASVRETGNNISVIRKQAESVKSDLYVLDHKSLTSKLVHLAINTRYDIAQQTLANYKPGVPFSMASLVCALLGGVLMSMLFNSILFIPRLFKRKPEKSPAVTKKRIEPTVTRVARAG
tara:strand:- start:149 stop:715 length:567 start_codon:yes stop_codon:yes gene_type:complete